VALTKFTTGNRGPDHLTRPPEYKPLPKPKPRAPDHLTRPVQGRGPVLVQAAPQPQPVFQVVQPQPVISPEYVSMYRPEPQPERSGPWIPSWREAVGMYGINVAPRQDEMQVGYNPATAGVPITRSEFIAMSQDPVASGELGRRFNIEPATMKPRDVVQAESVARYYDNMATMGERDRKRREREASDRTETDKQLTAEQWAAMSPLQQSAVMVNVDLDQAIKRDIRWQSKNRVDPTDPEAVQARKDQLEKYQKRLKELGIEGYGFGGLEYAPNTLAFLDKRGITAMDLAGKTLDDLISGDSLITMKQVEQIGQEVPTSHTKQGPFGEQTVRGPESRREQNLAFAQALAKGQLAYQEELAKKLQRGDQLLTDITGREQNAGAAEDYGALKMRKRTKLTKVRPETEAEIGKFMEILARPDIDLKQGMSAIQQSLAELEATPEEQSQVYQTLLEQARQGATGEGGWFDNIEYEMRDPMEVAQALGGLTLKRAPKEE
jgi:hypothetical protein